MDHPQPGFLQDGNTTAGAVQAAVPLSRSTPIAVVGAGAMGSGIALVAAAAGHPVMLFDVAPGQAEAGIARLHGDYDKLVNRGRLDLAEASARLGRLRPAGSLEELAPAGLVIEAIVEQAEIKAALFGQLEAVVADTAILATNTSSLSVTALAARLRRPERFAGLHFFNPAQLMPLVEVVSGHATEAGVVDCLVATARAWNKVPVRCQATPGFIVNRVARPFYAEALRLLAERAASPAVLDAVMRDSGGFRMGPCELMDMIGHDVNLAVTRSVYEAFFEDPRYRPSLVQQALVDARQLGRKSGRGFFDYNSPAAARPAIAEAASAPAPRRVQVDGDLGPTAVLADMAHEAGMEVTVTDAATNGVLRLDGAVLALTDGRPATQRAAAGEGPVVVFDLARDYRATTRIAVAAADQSGADALQAACGFFQTLGKAVTVMDDVPGLVVMRTVAMLANEAAEAVLQGVASASDVDLSMLKGVNYPEGPLAWADRLGARRVAAVIDALAACYGEDRYRCSPLLRRRAWSDQPLQGASA